MILIIICLIALQAIANLIADWNVEPETFVVDEDEIKAIRKSVGTD
ncbi:MAG: hypothetical protein AAFQ09_09675 [Pseudomonadota bacterium]